MNNHFFHKIQKALNFIRKDRTVKTLLLALVLIIIMGMLRPNTSSGIYEKRFWATKISWRDYADVVITGDSRVLGGISPAQMSKILRDRLIVNYGFVSNLYVPEYLKAIEDVLKQNSDKKTIILGITPYSLTEYPDMADQFFKLKSLSKRDIFMDIHFAALLSFFDYMSFRDALLGIFPGLASGQTHKEFFADGWLAFSKNPPGKKRELKKYRLIYEENQVSQQAISNLMDYVRRWTRSGIKVYAFLVPTCAEMAELEKELSGFNRAEFIKTLKDAGGIWIEINPADYESFDGSHLQRESALRLSQELASKIYEIEHPNEKVFGND